MANAVGMVLNRFANSLKRDLTEADILPEPDPENDREAKWIKVRNHLRAKYGEEVWQARLQVSGIVIKRASSTSRFAIAVACKCCYGVIRLTCSMSIASNVVSATFTIASRVFC